MVLTSTLCAVQLYVKVIHCTLGHNRAINIQYTSEVVAKQKRSIMPHRVVQFGGTGVRKCVSATVIAV